MERDPDCIFCKLIAGEIPSTKVYEDEFCLAFRDIDPQAPTHIQLIPKAHIARIDDVREGGRPLLGHLLERVGHIARQEGLCEGGFRTVINSGEEVGQVVFHIHIHILAGRSFSWPPG